jgi:hypothetical protein
MGDHDSYSDSSSTASLRSRRVGASAVRRIKAIRNTFNLRQTIPTLGYFEAR